MGLNTTESLESLERAMNGNEKYNDHDEMEVENHGIFSFCVICRRMLMTFISLMAFTFFVLFIQSKINDIIPEINKFEHFSSLCVAKCSERLQDIANRFIIEKIILSCFICVCLQVITIIYLRQLDKKMEKYMIDRIIETQNW